jgi:hypothetical protein
MVDTESPAQRYRRLAEECLEIAYTFPDGERRTLLVQMAQVWQRLADERASSAAMRYSRGPRVKRPRCNSNSKFSATKTRTSDGARAGLSAQNF